MISTLYGPDFSDARDRIFSDSRGPMIIFSDFRDPIFNYRDPKKTLIILKQSKLY